MKSSEEILEETNSRCNEDDHWAQDVEGGRTCYACAVEAIDAAKLEGFQEALRLYAWWKDGEQYVGSGLRTLEQALKNSKRDCI